MVDNNSDFDLINDGDCEPYEKLLQKYLFLERTNVRLSFSHHNGWTKQQFSRTQSQSQLRVLTKIVHNSGMIRKMAV